MLLTAHFHLQQAQNSPPTTFNFIKKMNLSTDQRLALAQRIADEYRQWINNEFEYQVEDMKDNDELSWDYYTSPTDIEDIINLVTGIISVPVA